MEVCNKDFSVSLSVSNVVGKLDAGTNLDLRHLHFNVRNTDYNPFGKHGFNGCVWRFRKKLKNKSRLFRITMLLFTSGKVVLNGGKSVRDIQTGAKVCERVLQKLGVISKKRKLSPEVTNVVMTGQLPGLVNLFMVAAEFLKRPRNRATHFEPEIFPGATVRFSDSKIIINLFASGKFHRRFPPNV
jgi:transcription initiation factor TFIID TATA-box-binding protein